MKDKQREDEKRKRRAVIIAAIILLLIVGVTIGYAGLSTKLTINGNTNIKKPNWDIHFQNVQVKSGSATASHPATISNTEKTKVNYTVTLEYGQFYEFDVDVTNAGSLDAKVSSVVKSGLSADQAKYLKYTVKYKNGTDIGTNDELKAGQTKTYTVRLEYDPNTPEEDLPTADVSNVNLSFEVVYVQA